MAERSRDSPDPGEERPNRRQRQSPDDVGDAGDAGDAMSNFFDTFGIAENVGNVIQVGLARAAAVVRQQGPQEAVDRQDMLDRAMAAANTKMMRAAAARRGVAAAMAAMVPNSSDTQLQSNLDQANSARVTAEAEEAEAMEAVATADVATAEADTDIVMDDATIAQVTRVGVLLRSDSVLELCGLLSDDKVIKAIKGMKIQDKKRELRGIRKTKGGTMKQKTSKKSTTRKSKKSKTRKSKKHTQYNLR